MKKSNFKRALSLSLMLVMLVSLASIGVSASIPDPSGPDYVNEVFGTAIQQIFVPDEENPDYFYINGTVELPMNWDFDVVVSASDFDQYLQPHKYADVNHEIRDITLELAGVKINDQDLPLKNLEDEVVIPAFPEWDPENPNDSMNAQIEWLMEYTTPDTFPWNVDEFGDVYDPDLVWFLTNEIMVTYKWHHHNLQGSQMYFDDNYHWQLCTECGNRAYLANHTDKDNDDKCDFCGNAIRYYNVTVKDVTGGKVTLSANKGAMNDKITVTVTPDAGYHLEALNFVNANALHSKRAVYEDTPNAEYHFFVANWDVEVEAIFVKD